VKPDIRIQEVDEVYTLLKEGEVELFYAMEKRDQRHGIAVMRRLRRHGIADSDLLVAALLHDCGKGRAPLRLRTLNVVAGPLVRLLSHEDAPGWRGAAYRLAHHAVLGAGLAGKAGSTPATVRYISGRVRPEEEAKIALLRSADDAS